MDLFLFVSFLRSLCYAAVSLQSFRMGVGHIRPSWAFHIAGGVHISLAVIWSLGVLIDSDFSLGTVTFFTMPAWAAAALWPDVRRMVGRE